jgi:chaperone modulatory protein CbpM
METEEFLVRARLDAQVLEAWLEARWLLPARQQGALSYSDIDLARAQLIRDLTQDLGVNEEGVPIILDLIDQLHELRRAIGGLAAAIGAQPDAMRREIIAAMRRAGLDGPGEAMPRPSDEG